LRLPINALTGQALVVSQGWFMQEKFAGLPIFM
jgi:hypothetical protein